MILNQHHSSGLWIEKLKYVPYLPALDFPEYCPKNYTAFITLVALMGGPKIPSQQATGISQFSIGLCTVG